MPYDRSILVLGGAGLVGSQVVREVARELNPERVIVASLFRGEVREFLHELRREFPRIEFIGVWGDLFVRKEFTMERHRRLLQSSVRREMLFQDLYGDIEETYKDSSLTKLINHHSPEVIVDCINTATALSYRDLDTVNKRAHETV
jgi:UDP-glucose 4-epimerase